MFGYYNGRRTEPKQVSFSMSRYRKRTSRRRTRSGLANTGRWRSRLVGLAVMAFMAFAANWLNAQPGRQTHQHAVKQQSNKPSTQPSSSKVYTLEGQISRVSDGDTVAMITSEGKQRIRLASIDAPETGKPKQAGQPYGDASRQYLAKMVDGRRITARCYERDHYQRHVCDLMLANNQTANRLLVEAGLAWANQQNRGKYLRDKHMLELEQQARLAKRGLWQARKPVAPWDWRFQCWKKGRCE